MTKARPKARKQSGKPLGGWVESELYEAVQEIAKKQGRRPSQVVRSALAEYVEHHTEDAAA